ncbi:HAMP domain-containing sensor histidine kinase [Pantoea sp. At-9b]|uniref:sensor histidine kinase n=1 Tax=Pantoea sp. (strain At-9b) TaxID=592316 RepID=UPI0001B3EAC9|nr:HAMP domain-containing sensor histidine kinase [Pantoea sp. At-9b]ADU71978.1 integral membrane sensor signal transduction histidine kinase [Pantoea sp. At-9b]
MRRFFSTTLGHILIIISCSTVITFLALSTLLFIPKGPPGPPWPWQTTYHIASVVKILRGMQPEQRAAVLDATQHVDGLLFKLVQQPTRCTTDTFNTWDLAKTLSWELGDKYPVAVFSCNAANPRKDIQVIIPLGGSHLEVMVDNIGREPTRFTFPTFCAILFLLTGIIAMSVWAIGRIISPLRKISEKADLFSRDLAVMPIQEEGPLELRRVAQTFNLLQERIAHSLESRSRMLAAISHDLRTPLTRMRLCLETHASERVSTKLIKEIDLMNKLIGSALAFIRTGSDGEQSEWVDLDALLTTLSDEYEDAGSAIDYHGQPGLAVFCKPDAIQRVITNLIDNALAHSHQIAVHTTQAADQAIIEIIDNGPGIPAEMLERVKEPFFRLDAARNERKGSAGLGLSIVNDIIKLHGGTFTLRNHLPTGLIARVVLPQAPTPP